MSNPLIYDIQPIEFRLDLKDPFIFTAHHIDYFPAGNEQLGPVSPPTADKPYRMYYGDVVPGFPEHPHTGFETITLVERGYVDHFDSLGNSGRYAEGDVQWLSTGNGVEHCEMFPLLHQDKENTFELFQIWFNSSPEEKTHDADYKMMWRENIPHVNKTDANGKPSDIRVISGVFEDTLAISRPPHSWAASAENKVNIYMIVMQPNAELDIPATTATSTRFAYYYEGPDMQIAGQNIPFKHLVELKPDEVIHLKNGEFESRILWLEGEPIGAPVAMRGPFVLNSDDELNHAFARYRQTHFGPWPWPSPAPVFKREQPRFASYKKGQEMEYPENNQINT
ncbi:pirin family protein [Acinetobacter sp. 194]|uniref:pirin family protein n=1 Tax=Acinetobacter shaoyimingii TaxID=2715164 RepID=UPI0014098CF3|nr:pirin family protein [Acinetobacter shaoyimingii]NHB58491.1 pirin family protein [Acinetobacter shaoyimingii]